MSLWWYDTIDRVGRGRKRHIYRQESRASGLVYTRYCGTSDGGGQKSAYTFESSDKLEYVEQDEILTDANVCETCLRATGLDAVKPKSSGAESVTYDPFGVFTDES